MIHVGLLAVQLICHDKADIWTGINCTHRHAAHRQKATGQKATERNVMERLLSNSL